MNLLLAAALLAQAPTPPLDPKDACSIVEHAVANTRSQKSYETSFKARLTAAQGGIDYSGSQVWVSPGILYLGYTATGGDDRKIICAGKDAWVYSATARGFLTADDNGASGAGRGIQNPDEVLAVVGRNCKSAKFLGSGAIELGFSGDDLKQILKDHVQAGGFNWAKSSARLEFTVDADRRLKTLSCAAFLDGKDPGRYSMDVTFVSFNTTKELKFNDEKDRPIPFASGMKEKMDAILEGKR
jgi:hypothetical protein